jgi:WD40 repeat protein
MRSNFSIIATKFLTYFVAFLLVPVYCFSADVSSQPELRINTEMHTSQIRRVVVDSKNQRLFTCSDDKTIRVWQFPTMKLLKVFRVPIGGSHEGQIYAMALSPDGSVVAAAGWTGWDWEKKSSIYFFDVASGELNSRFSGFDNVVNSLNWLPNGNLVVGLQGNAGLKLVDPNSKSTLASDNHYIDDITDIDINKNGFISVIALDGLIRLYDYSLKLIKTQQLAYGTKPVSVKFSPDAKSIAIAFIDKPIISILSATTLEFDYSVNNKFVKNQIGYTSVAWSSDGNYVFGSGQFSGEGFNPIYSWGNRGKSKPLIVPATLNRVSDIQAFDRNQIVFVSEDPSIGLMNEVGSVKYLKNTEISDFSHQPILLSVNADYISFGSASKNDLEETKISSPARTRYFSVLDDLELGIAQKSNIHFYGPILQSKNIEVKGWHNGFKPSINGVKIKLEEYEFSRCYSIEPLSKNVLFGTEWAIRLFNINAEELWHVDLPAVAWSVNISRDRKFAVAGLSDGTVRWYSMYDGKEVIAFFPNKNSDEWILWTPDGYYRSSLHGDELVGWQINHGLDLTPDYYRAVQFERVLFRPDMISGAFKQAGRVKYRAVIDSELTPSFDIKDLKEISPPKLSISILNQSSKPDNSNNITLKVHGEKNGLPIHDFVVFLNDIPVTSFKERELEITEQVGFTRVLNLDLNQQFNTIRVEAFNGVSMGVAESFVQFDNEFKNSEQHGDLYVLAVGVNKFRYLPDGANLSFATNDAIGISKAFQQEQGRIYNHVYTKTISDESLVKPGKSEIIDALNFGENAGPNDTVIIFLASHGISDPQGNYYFVPNDSVIDDVVSAQAGGTSASLISWSVFFDALRKSSGRRILIVDTCNASNIEGKLKTFALAKRSATSKFALVVASKGDEESQEYLPAKHGLFTYALLSSLDKSADSNHDDFLSLEELYKSSYTKVERLRFKKAGPQTPQLISIPILSASKIFSFH